MKRRDFLCLCAVIMIMVITWGVSINQFNIQEIARDILGIQKAEIVPTTKPVEKCNLNRVCPPNYFALYIRSGAADVVGPKICFEGKIVMSNVMNNVGPGLNIVQVNGENGTVENLGYLNMKDGDQEDILAYLKAIKPGTIILVASHSDVTLKLTDEMREIFVGMGSTLIKSVRHRDNWVFAGRAGTRLKSLFEKRAVNDEKTNIYGQWPEMVQVGGCFPRKTRGKGFSSWPRHV